MPTVEIESGLYAAFAHLRMATARYLVAPTDQRLDALLSALELVDQEVAAERVRRGRKPTLRLGTARGVYRRPPTETDD